MCSDKSINTSERKRLNIQGCQLPQNIFVDRINMSRVVETSFLLCEFNKGDSEEYNRALLWA